MARYRKLDVRTWNDEKFRSLSPLPPSGQSLWLYMTVGPFTSNIPGLFEGSEVGMADKLKWSLKAFREAFREGSLKGMAKADWEACLVWLPNAPRYNRPESPNVLISWGSIFDELPECALKREAYHALKAFAEGWGEAFSEAFAKAFHEPLPQAFGESVTVTRAVAVTGTDPELGPTDPVEQSSTPGSNGKSDDRGPIERVFDHWREVHRHPKASLDAKRRKLIRTALKAYSEADLCQSIAGYLNSPHHMGDNDRGTTYTGIELLLRDAAHIDAGLRFYAEPPRTDLSSLTRRNLQATEDWIPPELRNATE